MTGIGGNIQIFSQSRHMFDDHCPALESPALFSSLLVTHNVWSSYSLNQVACVERAQGGYSRSCTRSGPKDVLRKEEREDPFNSYHTTFLVDYGAILGFSRVLWHCPLSTEARGKGAGQRRNTKEDLHFPPITARGRRGRLEWGMAILERPLAIGR